MSSNGTASPGAGAAGTPTPCCKATSLLVVAATSFVCCFILVVAFLFVRFLLIRRRWRHGARGLLQEQHRRPKRGLDAAAIAMIPSFPYRAGADEVDAEGSASASVPAAAAECAVCLGALDEGQMVRQLPGCKHVFHQECIDVWLASRASCPVCRGKAEPAAAARADDWAAAAAAASTMPARVVAVEMFDVEEGIASSSSTPRQAESAPWTTRPEAASVLV